MDSRTKLRWPYFIDGALDGIVVAFAAWTVFYQFALVFQFSMFWAGWPWLLLAGLLAVGGGLHAVRRAQRDAVADEEHRSQPSSVRQPTMLAIVAALALVVLLTARREQWGVWPVAIVAIGLLAAQLLPWWKQRVPNPASATPPQQKSEASLGAHLFAFAVSAAFGGLGLFLLRPDADDAFYVNRATWVAQYGTAAENDTMFSPNTLPPANDGGLLTPSIEALQGVVAHAIGLEAPTVCYLLAVPVLGAMVGWTTWRLIRALAPRRQMLAMAVAMLFLLASADSVVGGYSLGRIWQGKAAAYSILIPLVWLLLMRTVDRLRRTELVMLVAAGIAFVGLTTTSALLAPVIAGAALLAAVLLRSKSLACGAVAFLAAPLINGLAQAFGPATIGSSETVVMAAQDAFTVAFGTHVAMVLLGLVAVALVPRLIPGAAGVVLGCGALATMIALVPGVFDLAHMATGSGPIAWRLLITMPLWILVGLLVTLPRAAEQSAHRRQNLLTAGVGVITAVVIAVPLVFGTLLWKAPFASLTSSPTWKVNQPALSDVRAARDLDVSAGLWLLPPEQMKVLAISAVGPFSVVPRYFYLPGLDIPAQERADREVLFNLQTGWEPVEPVEVKGALDRLDVSIACVPNGSERSRRVLREAIQMKLKPVGRMNCGLL